VLVVVETVSVVDTAPVPFNVTGFVANEHVGAPAPVSPPHDSVTSPLSPFAGVTVMVEVADCPDVTVAGLSAVAASE
jgi:hypothetical protein